LAIFFSSYEACFYFINGEIVGLKNMFAGELFEGVVLSERSLPLFVELLKNAVEQG